MSKKPKAEQELEVPSLEPMEQTIVPGQLNTQYTDQIQQPIQAMTQPLIERVKKEAEVTIIEDQPPIVERKEAALPVKAKNIKTGIEYQFSGEQWGKIVNNGKASNYKVLPSDGAGSISILNFKKNK